MGGKNPFSSLLALENFKRPESFFYFQKFGWKYLGFSFEDENLSKFQLFILTVHFGSVFFFGIFQCVFFYEHRGSLVLLADALVPFCTQIPVLLRVLVLSRFRKRIKSVIDRLRKSFINTTDLVEIDIYARANRLSTVVIGTLCAGVMLTVAFYLIFPITKDIYSMVTMGHRVYELPFKASFPFDIKYSPVFEIVYLITVNDAFAPSAAIFGCDGLISGVCAHVSAQFNIISHRIKHLVQQECHHEGQFISERQNEAIYKKLKGLVKLHNETIAMSEVLSECLWRNVLIYFSISSILICILCLVISEIESADVIIFVSYLLAYLTEMYSFAISGNMMINASLNVASAAYEFEWYKCSPKVRRAILMIIIRAQKKVNLQTPFIEVSLETFGVIIRAGTSYYTLVKSFV